PSKLKIAMVLFLILGLAAAGGAIAHQIAAAEKPEEPPELQQPLTKDDPDEPKKSETVEGRLDLHGDPLPPGAIARLGTVRFRPGGWLRYVAFTPDGKQIVSHNAGSDFNVWDTASDKELGRHTADGKGVLISALL